LNYQIVVFLNQIVVFLNQIVVFLNPLPHRGGFWQRRRNQRTRKETDQLELMRAQVSKQAGKPESFLFI